jgi:hypothetical protein
MAYYMAYYKGDIMRKHIGKIILPGLALLVLIGISTLIWLGKPAHAQNASIRSYSVLRLVTATEDTQLTASTQRTAPVVTDDGTVLLRGIPVGALHLRLKGTAAQNLTMSWTLWAYKNDSSPAKFVANGTATTGLTETGQTNEFYCDTIAITAQAWFKTVYTSDGAPDAIVNGGGIAELVFDTCEHRYFKIIIRDITGGGAEAATAGADYCTFF